MSTRFALRAAALSAATLLALTACGGDDDDPLGGPDSAPTGGGIGGAATIPDAATKNTEAGAEAFTKYYMEELLNKAYTTGGLTTLVKYSHPLCIVCRASIGDIATAWARGKVNGGQVTITGADATKASDTLTNVKFKYSKTRYVEVDGAGKEVFSTPAQKDLDITLQLQWNAEQKMWQVREIVTRQLQSGGAGATASPTP